MGGSEFTPGRSEEELEAVVRAGTEELLARMGPAFASGEGWVGGLRAAAYELRDFLREDERRARAMVLEAPTGNAATRRIREDGIAALAWLIDQGREESREEGVRPATAEAVAGAVYNRIHAGVARGTDGLDDEMVRELMHTAVLPYLGVEAALAELEHPGPAA